MNRVIRITHCSYKLLLVKKVAEVTKKPLLECKNIIDSVIRVNNNPSHRMNNYLYGTLCLNESSITPKQWQVIASSFKNTDLDWEYVETRADCNN